MTAFATREHALEALDNWAADEPLIALREYAELLSEYRLNACMLAEPAAALAYAHARLTPDQRAWCEEQVPVAGLNRFVPDTRAAERRALIALARGGS